MPPVVVVQARMSSARLPGKVLRPAHGKPLLGYLLERLARLAPDIRTVVATSGNADDDPVAAFCHTQSVTCVRGPLDDVASRFIKALDETGADAFVRVSGDSPLLDTTLVTEARALYAKTTADLVTNVKHRTYPKGMSVELLDAGAFRRARTLMTSAEDIEHVTPLFYRTAEDWRIAEFTSGRALGDINLSVDTEDDFRAFETLVARMDAPHWSYGLDEILKLRAGVELAST
ncbi:MAG: NTP transferase domain-containing protein [Alphaproteobacteria bacterium]